MTIATEPVDTFNFKYVALGTTICTIAYMLMHALVHKVSTVFNPKYRAYDRADAAEYRQYVVSPMHSLLAVMFATVTMFFMCGSNDDGLITVFNEFECLDQVRYWHYWAIMNTCGFFLTDFGYSFFVVKRNESLDVQMYVHHTLGFVTFFATIPFNNYMTVFGVMLLFVEVSSTYISLRWLLFAHDKGRGTCATLNSVAIFLAFLLGRVIF